MPSPMNFTLDVATDGTGTKILTLDPKIIDSVVISADADIYVGFGDLGQAKFPLQSNAVLSISHLDFKLGSHSILEKIYNLMYILVYKQTPFEKFIEPIDIYAKKQVAGAVNIHIAHLGGNV